MGEGKLGKNPETNFAKGGKLFVIAKSMISSGPKDLMGLDGEFKMLMSVKKKSKGGSKSGRHRKNYSLQY